MKIKKFAAQQLMAKEVAMTPAHLPPPKPVRLDPPKPSEWMTGQDLNLMRPKDAGTLQAEIVELKKIINERDAENKILKANSDKYEQRSKYIMQKFEKLK